MSLIRNAGSHLLRTAVTVAVLAGAIAARTRSQSVSVAAQSARGYFKELKQANAFNHYGDEYVCFRDDDVPSFAVVAKIADIIDHMKTAGNKAGVKDLEQAKGGLTVETYYKGVSNGTNVFDAQKSDVQSGDSKDYSYTFARKNPGKILYSINWATGRYRLRIFMYQKSRTIPAAEGSGKCELIHPVQP